MQKAINFLRKEFSDLERLMQALENAMELRHADDAPDLPAPGNARVFGDEPALSLWVE